LHSRSVISNAYFYFLIFYRQQFLEARCKRRDREAGLGANSLMPLCFVQLLLADIVVSFLLLSLHCGALLFYTACIVIAFVAVAVVAGVVYCCCCCCCLCWWRSTAAVSYLYPVGSSTSHTFMSIGARPFPFHFRYCKTFRIKYIFLWFCSRLRLFHFDGFVVVLGGFCTLAKLFVAIISGTLFAHRHYCTCFLYCNY